MEFEIDQARFLSALALAQTVADKRATMPVLANVLLRASSEGHLVCAATDMMSGLTETIPADVKTPGSLTVGVRHLHGIIRTLPAGPLRFKGLDNHWAQIQSGRSEFKLMGIPGTDFPGLPAPKSGKRGPEFFDVPSHALADLIQKTLFSVSTDEARSNLNGVLFECDGATGTMVSTDSHRLTRYTLPLAGPKLDKGIIIPRKGMLEIRRVLDRVQGTVGLAVGTNKTVGFGYVGDSENPTYEDALDDHLFVRAEELLLSVKLNNISFPPYKAVIPTNHRRYAVASREEMLSALRRAEIMAPEKTATVRLQLTEGKLELTADNPNLGVAHQELAVEYTGDPLTAGFNARYLIEVLETIDTDEIRLEFQGELDPCVVKPVDGPDFLGLVMPMRI